jgi:hypothetical protein
MTTYAYTLYKRAGALVLIGLVAATTGCGSSNGGATTTPPATPPPAAPPPPPPTGIVTFTINPTTGTAPSQTPTFEAKTFGAVGTYDKIRGTAAGKLDPKDPKNADITDIALAPTDANGLVDYNVDFYILKPSDLTKGNHKVFFELVNRGSKQFGPLNLSGGGNDPTTAADAGTAFLENMGYTMVWTGWESTVSRANNSMGVTTPVPLNADGSTITGPVYEYLETDAATTTTMATTYTTNDSTDTTTPTLTVKAHLTDTPTPIAATAWTWASPTSIALLPAGTKFTAGSIYELTYTAKNPWVAGIGFAAVRDLMSFLRTAKTDVTSGTANPLAGDVTRVVTYTLSQPSRTMNDFVWLGFNQDLNGKQVVDGMFSWVGAGDGVALNYRFEQSGMTERNRQQHFYPEAVFPFAFQTTTDSLSGKTDGKFARCTTTNTCPTVMNINSAGTFQHAQLPDLRRAARLTGRGELPGSVPAVRELDRSVPRIARPVRRPRRMARWHPAAAQRGSEPSRWHGRVCLSDCQHAARHRHRGAGGFGIPHHPRRVVHGRGHHPQFVQLGPGFRQGHHRECDPSSDRQDVCEFRLQGRCGWQ